MKSIALQQAALAHILNAEGEKIQRIVGLPDVSPESLLAANQSVEAMVNAVANLESILKQKLKLFDACSCDCEAQ